MSEPYCVVHKSRISKAVNNNQKKKKTAFHQPAPQMMMVTTHPGHAASVARGPLSPKEGLAVVTAHAHTDANTSTPLYAHAENLSAAS